MTNPHIGTSFESFLEEEGLREEVEVAAQKRVIAWQLREAMREAGLSKMAMAARMHTSRSQIDRLLDPSNDRIQLDTLQRAAQVLGRTLRFELV
jgi:hypothetical protein